MPARDIVVIGTSMGGLEAISSLAGQLPEDFAAAVFVVQHLSARAPGLLSRILSNQGPLPAVTAEDGMDVVPGRIYVAPPDRHLLLTPGGIRVVFGPRENYSRPAIDPLFRTAAVHGRSRVVGVVLTGLLYDGAAGLLAVQRCGGLTVVQAPEDAAYPEMPRSALAVVEPDHQVALADLGGLLVRLVAEPAPPPPDVPEDLRIEAQLTERAMEPADWRKIPGSSSLFTCPDCGGSLREIGDEPLRRYRCHVGHAFTEQALLDGQDHAIEEALWVALRTLKERTRILESMTQEEETRGRSHSAAGYRARAEESRAHEEQIRALLARLC